MLLLTAYSYSALGLLNREKIAAELVQAVIGSFAILLTVPLTALLASALYPRAEGEAPAGQELPVMPATPDTPDTPDGADTPGTPGKAAE